MMQNSSLVQRILLFHLTSPTVLDAILPLPSFTFRCDFPGGWTEVQSHHLIQKWMMQVANTGTPHIIHRHNTSTML
jgi:hypothetical protein